VLRLKSRILIVDDEAQFRYSVGIALKKGGYDVTEASDASEALDIIAKEILLGNIFSLVLLDMQMPRQNGIDFLNALSEKNIRIPVLAVSGFIEKGMADYLIERGCLDIMQKPFEHSDLIRNIDKILKKTDLTARADTI
jgi:DNA-binding NtrC family response regulator